MTYIISNWLVYGLKVAGLDDELLVVDGNIQLFSTTDRAKAFRAEWQPHLQESLQLKPLFLDDIKAGLALAGDEFARVGIDLNGTALSTGNLSGC